MKKISLSSISLLFVINFSYAQWTGGPTGPIYYNGGNVGIGTTSPGSLLQIGSATTRGTLSLIDGTGSLPAFTITNLATGGHSYTFYGGISGTGNFDLYDQTISAYRLTVAASGNVGIGTTAPNALLSFSMPVLSAVKTYTTDNQSGVSPYIVSTGDLGGYLDLYATRSGDGSSQGGSTIRFLNQGYTDTSPTGIERMRIAQNGYVGIGTATPDEMLAVDGTIHSKEVKVNLAGLPDYVFKAGYRLPAMSEVKAYISKNKHLPDMPSAAEVEKKGLNLGEMDAKLLQKVEELTLYIIQQKESTDKQIRQLKKQISKLQKNKR